MYVRNVTRKFLLSFCYSNVFGFQSDDDDNTVYTRDSPLRKISNSSVNNLSTTKPAQSALNNRHKQQNNHVTQQRQSGENNLDRARKISNNSIRNQMHSSGVDRKKSGERATSPMKKSRTCTIL